MDWLWGLISGRVAEPRWSQRPKYAARYPFSHYAVKWEAEARAAGNDTYLNELSEEITIIKTNNERRLRTLMNQGRPCLPGSPRVWQWRVDDAAERRCFTVLIEDALSGSIYDSGAPEYAVLRGPPHLTGIELKERFYQENQGVPMMWTVEPSLSGYHYWRIIHLHETSPTASTSRVPLLSDSVPTESHFGGLETETPTSSVPVTPWTVGSCSRASVVDAPIDTGSQAARIDGEIGIGSTGYGRSVEKDTAFSNGAQLSQPTRPRERSSSRICNTRPQLHPVQESPAPRGDTRQPRQPLWAGSPATQNSAATSRQSSPSRASSRSSSITSTQRRQLHGASEAPVSRIPLYQNSALQRNPSQSSLHRVTTAGPPSPIQSLHPTRSPQVPATPTTARPSKRAVRSPLIPQMGTPPPGLHRRSSQVMKRLQAHLQQHDIQPEKLVSPERRRSSANRQPWLSQRNASSTTSLPGSSGNSIPSQAVVASPVIRRKASNASSAGASSPSKSENPTRLSGSLSRRRGQSVSAVMEQKEVSQVASRPPPFRQRGNSNASRDE